MNLQTRNPLIVDVSCQECARHSTPECADCLVSYVIGGTPEHLSLSSSLAAAADVLVSEGLLPELKYRPGGLSSPH
jgi:hypothetical protein